jgi:hypothetical protein
LLPLSLSVPVFLRDFPIMVLNQQLLANFGLMVIPALEVLLLPLCRPRTEPGVYIIYVLCYIGGDLIDFDT